MKLYEVPNNTKVQLLEKPIIPSGAISVDKGDIIYFNHIDGMYSHCIGKNNSLVHIGATTEIKIVE